MQVLDNFFLSSTKKDVTRRWLRRNLCEEVNQFAITAIDFLENSPKRMMEALKEDWDLVIIDEAHHYRWFEEEPNLKWIIAKKLSDISKATASHNCSTDERRNLVFFILWILLDSLTTTNF